MSESRNGLMPESITTTRNCTPGALVSHDSLHAPERNKNRMVVPGNRRECVLLAIYYLLHFIIDAVEYLIFTWRAVEVLLTSSPRLRALLAVDTGGSYVKRIVPLLTKKPNHVGIVVVPLKNESPLSYVSLEQIYSVLQWARQADIPYISVYDREGVYLRARSTIDKLVQRQPHQQPAPYLKVTDQTLDADVPLRGKPESQSNSPNGKLQYCLRNGFAMNGAVRNSTTRPLSPADAVYNSRQDQHEPAASFTANNHDTPQLMLLCGADGKSHIIHKLRDYAKQKCSSSLQCMHSVIDAELNERLKSNVISIEGLDNMLSMSVTGDTTSTSLLPDPDLVIHIGSASSMADYLPWHIRLTEIYQVPCGKRQLTEREFCNSLLMFSKVEQRFGK